MGDHGVSANFRCDCREKKEKKMHDEELTRLRDELLSAAVDAHGLAMIYFKEAAPTQYGVIPGKVGLKHHAREFEDCRVPICTRRRSLVHP